MMMRMKKSYAEHERWTHDHVTDHMISLTFVGVARDRNHVYTKTTINTNKSYMNHVSITTEVQYNTKTTDSVRLFKYETLCVCVCVCVCVAGGSG